GSFAEPHAFETMLRDWHLDGLAVRPEHRMVGHTGFLVTARRLADGVAAPPRRRRPAKGAHGEVETRQAADPVGALPDDGTLHNGALDAAEAGPSTPRTVDGAAPAHDTPAAAAPPPAGEGEPSSGA